MDASQHIIRGLEDDEQHSIIESGWTMYIGSSIHEKDHYNFINGEYSYKQEEGNNKNQCPNYDDDDDDESDDSMASDASSGPIHHSKLIPSISTEQNLGIMDHCKHDDQTFKSISTKKVLHKKVKIIKGDQRRNKIGKEKLDDQLKAISSSASHVQSRGFSENQYD